MDKVGLIEFLMQFHWRTIVLCFLSSNDNVCIYIYTYII